MPCSQGQGPLGRKISLRREQWDARAGLGEQKFAALESGKVGASGRPGGGKGKGKGKGKKGGDDQQPSAQLCYNQPAKLTMNSQMLLPKKLPTLVLMAVCIGVRIHSMLALPSPQTPQLHLPLW